MGLPPFRPCGGDCSCQLERKVQWGQESPRYSAGFVPAVLSAPGKKRSKQQGNPDPRRFEVQQHQKYGKYDVLKVFYPGCMNYGGEKIMVVTGYKPNPERLDPHFCPHCSIKVLARFLPDKWGWRKACEFAMSCAKEDLR